MTYINIFEKKKNVIWYHFMKYPFLFESLRLSKKDDNYWILWITFKTQNDPWFLSLNQKKKKNRLSGVRYTKIDFLFLFYRILSILIYTRREGQCLKEIDNGLYYVFYWYLLLSIYIYKTEASEALTIFHVSIIFKK